MLICRGCQKAKPESEYYFTLVEGRHYIRKECKVCTRLKQAASRFGITLEQLNKMYKDQDHKCKICDRECLSYERLSIDHDHKCCPTQEKSCGKCVRGLLCARCNKGLGIFEDDPELLRSAINYLGV